LFIANGPHLSGWPRLGKPKLGAQPCGWHPLEPSELQRLDLACGGGRVGGASLQIERLPSLWPKWHRRLAIEHFTDIL
jgi:hypothetical protein